MQSRGPERASRASDSRVGRPAAREEPPPPRARRGSPRPRAPRRSRRPRREREHARAPHGAKRETDPLAGPEASREERAPARERASTARPQRLVRRARPRGSQARTARRSRARAARRAQRRPDRRDARRRVAVVRRESRQVGSDRLPMESRRREAEIAPVAVGAGPCSTTVMAVDPIAAPSSHRGTTIACSNGAAGGRSDRARARSPRTPCASRAKPTWSYGTQPKTVTLHVRALVAAPDRVRSRTIPRFSIQRQAPPVFGSVSTDTNRRRTRTPSHSSGTRERRACAPWFAPGSKGSDAGDLDRARRRSRRRAHRAARLPTHVNRGSKVSLGA